MLRPPAGREWGVDAAALVVAEGKLSHPATGRTIGFGALTRGQKLVRSLAGEIALTPPERWTVAGRSVPKLGARDIVTGRHRYASDLSPAPFKPSEMLYGRVLRPPAVGATLASIEPANEESLAGVVLFTDAEFVGVAAKRSSQAARALEGLRPKWNLTPQPEGRELFEHLRQPPEGPREGRRGFVVPGTRVDVVVTLSRREQESLSRVVVSNVQVLTAGTKYDQEQAKDGKPVPSTVVTLLVTPEDAERIALASAEGTIMLTLRNPLDTTPTETKGTRLASLMGAPDPPPVTRVVQGVRRAVPPPAPAAVPAPPPVYAVETIRAAKRTSEVVK